MKALVGTLQNSLPRTLTHVFISGIFVPGKVIFILTECLVALEK